MCKNPKVRGEVAVGISWHFAEESGSRYPDFATSPLVGKGSANCYPPFPPFSPASGYDAKSEPSKNVVKRAPHYPAKPHQGGNTGISLPGFQLLDVAQTDLGFFSEFLLRQS
jgi:hypothetical protein